MEISFNDAVNIALRKFLPQGYKPEDYLIVDKKYPLWLLRMICREANHIVKFGKRNTIYDA